MTSYRNRRPATTSAPISPKIAPLAPTDTVVMSEKKYDATAPPNADNRYRAVKRTCPRMRSKVGPRANSTYMLKAMCRKEPCKNALVNNRYH